MRFHLPPTAACAALAFAAAGATAQGFTFDARRTSLTAHYIVGYAAEYTSDTFSQTLDTVEPGFDFERARSGSIDSEYRGQAINGFGSYAIAQHYGVGADGLAIGGSAHNVVTRVQEELTAGARAISTLWLDFTLQQATPFTLNGMLEETAGTPLGTSVAEAAAIVVLENVAGSSGRWRYTEAGAFAAQGVLPPGRWRLYGSADTRNNGDAAFAAALALSPVSEPASGTLAAAGALALVLRRRRIAARATGVEPGATRVSAARGAKRNSAARIACVALLAAAGAAHAVPGAVDTLGQPEWFTTYRLLTPAGFGTFEIRDQDDAVNGTTAVFHSEGTMWDRSVANQQAVVTNNGVTYWSWAMGPTLEQAPTLTTVTGAVTSANVAQSFRKVEENAELRFTYTGGRLELFKHPEIGAPCEQGCAFAEVVWQVQVTRHDAPNAPLMTETGRAAMGILGGEFRFYSSQWASDGSPANPLWQWDCDRCDQPARNLATATLDAPFTGIVDLSAIPFDAQQPVDFTVTFSLWTTAYVTREWMGARAWARDPLAIDDGVSIAVSGLVPTNAPVAVVPEPGSWVLLLGGLAALAARRRHRA
jgi:hypothetical protein